DRPERSGGEGGDHSFRHVRQISRDPIAGDDSRGGKRGLIAGDLRGEIGEAQLALAALLVPGDQGGVVVAKTEKVLGVIELRAAEPARAGLSRWHHTLAPFENRVPWF